MELDCFRLRLAAIPQVGGWKSPTGRLLCWSFSLQRNQECSEGVCSAHQKVGELFRLLRNNPSLVCNRVIVFPLVQSLVWIAYVTEHGLSVRR